MRSLTQCAVLGLAAGLTFTALPGGATEGDRPVPSRPLLRVRKAAQPVSINGILSEWRFADTACFVPSEPRAVPGGNRVAVMAEWDHARFYVAFRVYDTELNALRLEDGGSVWLDDCVEVYLSTAPAQAMERGLSPSEYQFVVNLNAAHCTIRGTGYVTGLEENTRDFWWKAEIAEGVRTEGTLNDNTDIDAGYTVEIGIPWDILGLSPEAGDTLLADFCIEDRDDRGFYSFDWAGLDGFDQPARWGRIVLEGSPERRPLTAMVSRPWTWFGGLGALLALIAGIATLSVLRRRGRQRMSPSAPPRLFLEPSSAVPGDIRQRVEIILETEYGNEITTADMAVRLELSERHLQRLLKKAVGKPFRDFLTDFRLQKARQLLSAADKPVTRICFDVGFGDYSHFARVFKKAFGCSPLEYRRQSGRESTGNPH